MIDKFVLLASPGLGQFLLLIKYTCTYNNHTIPLPTTAMTSSEIPKPRLCDSGQNRCPFATPLCPPPSPLGSNYGAGPGPWGLYDKV